MVRSASHSLITDHHSRPTQRENAAFTLIELLVVVGIIGLLMVLIVPAFTSLRSGTDVTSAVYTVKGALDTARTYAKANNTYTWVGFYEENVSNPSSPNSDLPKVGRVVMSIVASKDGTNIYGSGTGEIDVTKLTQVGKLTKIENAHLWTHTDVPLGTGSTFDSRPNVASAYCIGDSTPADSSTPFRYPVGNPAPAAQYTFRKMIEFNGRGEGRINNSTNSVQALAEIALEPTHGSVAPVSVPGNVAAVQLTGFGGNATVYRK